MPAEPAPSRLVFVHAAVFTAGVVTFFLGVLATTPYLLLLSGPCFFLSGILIALGVRVTLAGPFGALLRTALGGPRVTLLWLRALVWIAAGVLVTLYAVDRLIEQQRRESLPPESIVGVTAAPGRRHRP